jgi:hypothetical protein
MTHRLIAPHRREDVRWPIALDRLEGARRLITPDRCKG